MTSKPVEEQRHERRDRPEPIASERINNDKAGKVFFIDLHENGRGRFVRVKERTQRGSSFIVIPEDDLKEMGELLLKIAAWSEVNS